MSEKEITFRVKGRQPRPISLLIEDNNSEGNQNNSSFVWLSLQKDPNEIQPNMLLYGNSLVTYKNIVEWVQQGKIPILKNILTYEDIDYEETQINFLLSYIIHTDLDSGLLTYEASFQGNNFFSSFNIDEPLKDTNSK